jgi:hypothetical protein
MELKECTTCNKIPEMSKEDGTWTISCKCGLKKTVIVTGNVSKESAIVNYLDLMRVKGKRNR